MSYRDRLPQLDADVFLTDGGIETVLIFHEGLELPAFAAFTLLDDGIETLRRYYEPYARLAREHGVGFVAEAPTWRASPRWAAELGYSLAELDALNRRAIALMGELRRDDGPPVVISGCVGPCDDGYDPAERLSAEAAEAYHAIQVGTFADTEADMVTAITMTYAEEAIGVARAAARHGLPAVISFTVETDGRLPSGQPLGEAIAQVDAACGDAVAYYMVNCAHPTHFDSVLAGPWLERVRGVRANASARSHAELDEATELDAGDPDDLAARYADLAERLPRLTVLGGCCGTDHRHIAAIAGACLSVARPA
ncbi:MAG TPA: homocysteine S-methyltransferase family protein [Solirubrobacter sp.]|nr:homocysteine S-methyltransferase family protein [Solirubrobacter sp.]